MRKERRVPTLDEPNNDFGVNCTFSVALGCSGAGHVHSRNKSLSTCCSAIYCITAKAKKAMRTRICQTVCSKLHMMGVLFSDAQEDAETENKLLAFMLMMGIFIQ